MFARMRRQLVRFSGQIRNCSSTICRRLQNNLLAFDSLNFCRTISMANTSFVGVIQLTSRHDIQENLSTIKQLIQAARNQNAKMVFLPECFDYVGRSQEETLSLAMPLSSAYVDEFKQLAISHKMWLSLGGFHEKGTDDSRISNSHIIIDDAGQIVQCYNKSHLFDIDIPGKVRLKETDFTKPGSHLIPPVDTPIGRLGLATCYDLRFPEHSALLRRAGAEVLTYPSAFTVPTGLAHWEPLLRARAIENQCYVIAAAQVGQNTEKRATYGHSMVVDPWGAIVAQCSDQEGICFAHIDLDYVRKVRTHLPCGQHRRTDLYALTGLRWKRAVDTDSNAEYAFGAARIAASCVFWVTEHSYAFVNRKPVLPGHVLVASKRVCPKLSGLTSEEIADLFNCVTFVQRMLEQKYEAASSTISLQDGPDAGQTVQHVHVHILPRKAGDFKDNDDVYKELSKHDKPTDAGANEKFRSIEDMSAEAAVYRRLLS